MNVRGRQIEVADEQCLAILLPHHAASRAGTSEASWRTILLRMDGESFSVIAERDVAAGDKGFAAWLAPHKPKSVLVVLPGSATVCRTCALPPAQGEQLASALRLQAETALLGGVPSHRVGMTALATNAGSPATAPRQGVIVAWPETAEIPELPELPSSCEVRFAPVVGCLIALMRGEMPTTPLIRADREDGTIVFLLGTSNGLLVRSTREDATESTAWRDGIQRAAAETLLAANRGADEIRTLQDEIAPQLAASKDGSFVLLPASVGATISSHLPGGRTGDPAKDADRTIALGAALAAKGPLAGLASIRRSLPAPDLHPVERISRWLATPRNTLAVIFIAMLVFLFGPLGFSAIRYGILRIKLPDPASVESLNRETQQSVLVYKQLQKEAWPMTKLIGDLSNSLPEGIDVEMMQIAHGDGVLLKGIAKPFDVKSADGKSQKLSAAEELTRMENLLRSTRIFTNAQYKWDPDDAKGYRNFTLTCNVSQPTRNVTWGSNDDYSKTTIRDRRYPNWREIEKGNHAAAAATATATDTDSGAKPPIDDVGARTARKPDATAKPDEPTKPSDTARAAGNRDAAGADETAKTEGDGTQIAAADSAPVLPARGIGRRPPPSGEHVADRSSGGDTAKPAQPASAPPVDVPGPFSDDEIKALNKAAAQELLGKISRARQMPTLDEDTKKRLKEDFNRVLAQAKAAAS